MDPGSNFGGDFHKLVSKLVKHCQIGLICSFSMYYFEASVRKHVNNHLLDIPVVNTFYYDEDSSNAPTQAVKQSACIQPSN